MAAIRPEALDAAGPINPATDVLIIDQGAGGVRKTVPNDIIGAARPLASQAEAEAGTDNVNTMTALRTAQAIEALGSDLFASLAQGALADSAVQPSRAIIAGTGLTGGGDLASDVAIALNAGTIASLALADSALQPGEGGTLPPGGPTAFALVKNSSADNDVSWQQVGDMRGTVYDPTGVGTAVSMFGDKAFRLDVATTSNTFVLTGFDKVIIDRWFASGPVLPTVWTRVASEPTHLLKLQDATGAWFEPYGSNLNALSFGCRPNETYSSGLAQRNRLSIQYALDMLTAKGGGVVTIPAGIIHMNGISNAGIRARSNTILRGEGMGATVLQFGPGQDDIHGVNFSGVINSVLEDLTIDLQRGIEPGNSGHGVRLGGNSSAPGGINVIIQRVETKNTSYGMGLQTGMMRHITIQDCYIHEAFRDAIDIKNYTTEGVSAENIVIRNNRLENWSLATISEGLTGQFGIHSRSPCRLEGNYLESNPTVGGGGIQIEPPDNQGAGAMGSIIANNKIVITNPDMYGIRNHADDVQIIGNYIVGGQRAIRLESQCKNVLVLGNNIKNSIQVGVFAADAGSSANGPINLRIIGTSVWNDFVSPSGIGIQVIAENVVIIGANVTNCAVGIQRDDTVRAGLKVIGCNLLGNTTAISSIAASQVSLTLGHDSGGNFQSALISVGSVGQQTVVVTHTLPSTPSLIYSTSYLFGSDTTFVGTTRISAVTSTTATIIVDITVPSFGAQARVGAWLRQVNAA